MTGKEQEHNDDFEMKKDYSDEDVERAKRIAREQGWLTDKGWIWDNGKEQEQGRDKLSEFPVQRETRSGVRVESASASLSSDPTQELVVEGGKPLAFRCPLCGRVTPGSLTTQSVTCYGQCAGNLGSALNAHEATRCEPLVRRSEYQALEARAEKLCEEADTLAHQAAGAVAEPRCFHENVRSHQQELGNAIARTRHALSAFNNQPTGIEGGD